jgi:pimeloyl-ACP methyl ester carboxylesterase
MVPPEILQLGEHERLRFDQRGTGPDVLLIHGTLVTLEDMMLSLGDVLSPTFRVTAVDRPGHGESTRPRLHGRLRDQTARIKRAADLLGLRRPIVVGHSMGATVAIAYALDYPEAVSGVVSLAPIIVPEPRLEHILFGPRAVPLAGDAIALGPGPLLDAALAPVLWRAMFLPQKMPATYAAQFPFPLAGKPSDMQATGEEAGELIADLTQNLMRYPASPVPVTVMTGDRDIVVSPAHGFLLSCLLPHGRYRRLPGLGHMVHHFAQGAILESVRALAGSAGQGAMPRREVAERRSARRRA